MLKLLLLVELLLKLKNKAAAGRPAAGEPATG
jgi:hypothetical protein